MGIADRLKAPHTGLAVRAGGARSRAAFWGIAGLAALAATWMSGGALHDHQNADSLLQALVSLQRWTPFYWEQNRFGMLIPLLAMPIHHPLANLIVQDWLATAAALLAPYLVARGLGGANVDWVASGSIANTLLVVFAPPAVQFDWLVTQPYALSISLAFGGLAALETPGLTHSVIGTLLMVLAHWVNVGVFILVIPVIAFARRLTPRSVAATTAGMAAGLLFAGLSSAPHTTSAMSPFAVWPNGWLQLLSHTASSAIEHRVWLGLLALIALALALTLAPWPSLLPPLWAAGAAFALAVEYWLVVGSSRWVELNVYLPRYLYPGLLLAGVGLSILLVSPFAAKHRRAAAVLFFVAVCIIYGVPSGSRVRRHLDDSFGRLTPEVLDSGATVIAGDYWTVWPAVFHANLTQYRRTGHAGVYGLTYRSIATDGLWCRAEDVLVAAKSEDRAIGIYADRISLPLRFLDHKTSIDLFAAGPCRDSKVSGF